MLSNAYFLAKFRFDAAENEPAKTLQKLLSLLQFCYQFPGTAARAVLPRSGAGRSGRAAAGRRVRRAVGAPGDCRRGPLSLSLSLRSACVCVCANVLAKFPNLPRARGHRGSSSRQEHRTCNYILILLQALPSLPNFIKISLVFC